MQRVDEGELVDLPCEVGEDAADPGAALAVPGPREGRLHQGPHGIGEEPGLGVEAGERLAIAPLQLGLVVPGVDLAGAAVHEQPDHGLGGGAEVGRPGGQRVRDRAGRGEAGAGEQGVERQQAEAATRAGEQLSAGKGPDPGVHRCVGASIRPGRHLAQWKLWRARRNPTEARRRGEGAERFPVMPPASRCVRRGGGPAGTRGAREAPSGTAPSFIRPSPFIGRQSFQRPPPETARLRDSPDQGARCVSNQSAKARMSQSMESQPCLPPGCTTSWIGRPTSRARTAKRSDWFSGTRVSASPW